MEQRQRKQRQFDRSLGYKCPYYTKTRVWVVHVYTFSYNPIIECSYSLRPLQERLLCVFFISPSLSLTFFISPLFFLTFLFFCILDD